MGEIISIREAYEFPDILPGFDPLHSVPCPARFRGRPLLIIGYSSRDNQRIILHPDRQSSVHAHTVTIFVHPSRGTFATTFEPFHPVIKLSDKNGPNSPQGSREVLDVSYLENVKNGAKRIFDSELYKSVPGRVTIENDRLYDGAQIYLLSDETYEDAFEAYLRWQRFPPDYQIAGISNPNCEVYSHAILKAAGIAAPLYPWPNVTASLIQKRYFRDAAREFFDPLRQYIPSQMIAQMALRAKELGVRGSDTLEIKGNPIRMSLAALERPLFNPFLNPNPPKILAAA